mmetsp:Transcript_55419/g.121263  ORF Transcript_55419/g.121263 Transcript_55419/m.121263 type:complete len:334 (+) Transcript_55419:84-1085(+)
MHAIRRNSNQNSLLCILVLRQGVNQCACNGNGAAKDSKWSDWVAEHKDGRNDDHDPLHGVAHCMRHWVQLAQRKEGNLVVHVVVESAEDHLPHEVHAARRKGHLEALDHGCGSLDGEADGDQHESGHDGQNRESVAGVHVLTDVSFHHLFAVHGSGCRAQVGAHSSSKAQPVKRELRCACQTNTANDGQERCIDLPWHHLTQEGEIQEGGHHRLRGFHNMSERHCASKEGDHSTNVSGQVAQRCRCQGDCLRDRKLWSLADAQEPERNKDQPSEAHLPHCASPGEWVGDQSLLVVDIVSNVKNVPHGDVDNNTKFVHKALLGLLRGLRGLSCG